MSRFGKAVRSVRGRITLVSTALVAVTLVVASMLLMRLVQADLLASAEETLDLALEAQADELAPTADDPLAEALLDGFDESFDLIRADIDGSAVEVGLFTADADGRAFGELYVDGRLAAGLVIDPESDEIVEIFDVTSGRPLPDSDLRDDIESMVFEVFDLSDDAGGRFLVGATPLDEIEESVNAIRDALVVIVPTLVALFGVATWWLVGRALRPVESIADQVQAISASSLDRRVPVPDSGDEVAELATVMNRMLDRLERGGERQRQFSADASHELRSPLATVRAAAEMLQRHPTGGRAAGLAEDIVAESDRMAQLIDDLLVLSRLDEDRSQDPGEQFDLAELIRRELVDDEVEVVGPPRLAMVGSPRQVRRLVRNLVDNAKRHAAGRVVLELRSAPGMVELLVDDDGPGVPEHQRAAIFERFSRLDDARTRGAGGFGLGLALVRGIAERHGGSATVTASPLGGARFVVSLRPVSSTDGPGC